MRKQVILCLKVAWVVAALTILLIGTNLCTSTEEACVAADNTMSSFMVLLTFPTGIFFFPIALAVVDSVGIHYPSDFIIGWSVLAIGGCVQWFYCVPRLLEKAEPHGPQFEFRIRALPVAASPRQRPANNRYVNADGYQSRPLLSESGHNSKTKLIV
jgi:hypothetical protein